MNITLGGLERGQYRELTEAEVAEIRRLVEGLHQSSHAGSHGRETGQHDQKTCGFRQEAGCQTGKEGPKWMIG